MKINPTIVFCTTCKNRVAHLSQTLPRNIADNADYPNAKFVVLDYADPGPVAKYVTENHAADIASGKVAYYRYSGAHPFQMAHAKNMAHRCGILEGADILVNLDADNFTGKGFAQYIADQFTTPRYSLGISSYEGYREVYKTIDQSEAQSWALEPGKKDETHVYHPLPPSDRMFLWSKMEKGVLPRGISGRIAVTKSAFLIAGGYDEKYDTWSPDDKDFNARLRRLGYEGVEIETKFLREGVPHNDRIRFLEYPHLKGGSGKGEGEVDNSFHIHPTNTVVNDGVVGCGAVHKISNGYTVQIELEPIPTRIFGIGMHKTATTSLHNALTILGYDSAHWKSVRWAKMVWKEMTHEARSLTVEQNYALCDLPITILYKELDAAYPGSKFILTLKDENKWLASVRDHWGYDTNRYRKSWDRDIFTHRLHNIVYGRKDFEPETFIARYRRHNAEVREYFKDRPNDLLIMDVDAGAGFKELCEFFGCADPGVAYPRIDPTTPESIEDFIKQI